MLGMLGAVSLFFMGGLLGLIGAGGSILTIPILVYLLGVSISVATTYSLVIVGVSSFAAVVRRRNEIMFSQSAFFIFPSFLGVILSRYFLLPSLTRALDQITLEKVLLGLLLILMVVAGHLMIRNTVCSDDVKAPRHPLNVTFIALSVGLTVGLLGVGGGFVIIPSLVLMLSFSIEQAVPTSLFIIVLNSMAGFAVDHHELSITQWQSLGIYLLISLIGMFAGAYLSPFIKSENIKKSFGYFIWAIAVMIFLKEWW